MITKKSIMDSVEKEDLLLNELMILDGCLHHENITQVMDLLHDQDKVYIVSELITDGDAFSFLERYFSYCGGPLSESLAKAVAH